MAYTDLRELRKCYASLRELIIHRNGGWDDRESREKATVLCDSGIVTLDDAECRERLRMVQVRTDDLYSRSGHLKWSRQQMSGADYLRLQILIQLEAINSRLFLIETERDKAPA